MKKILVTMLLVATGLLLKAQNVGIGTTTPTSKLHVVSTSNSSTPLSVFRSNGLTPLFRVIQGGSGNGSASIHNAAGDTIIQLSSNADSWLLGGSVGIGTNTPSAKLHVAGSFKLENGSEAANRVMVSSSNGTATWKDPSAAGLVSGSGATGRLAYWLSNDSITSSSLLNWDNTNKFLGIGSSTPSEKLDIVLGGSESGGLRIGESSKKVAFLGDSTTTNENGVLRLFDNAQTETVRLGANTSSFLMGGNLGIGTTSPPEELTVNGTDPSIQLQNANVNKGFLRLGGDSVILGTNIGNLGGSIHFRTYSANRMTIASNGFVGIGTSNPTNMLSVDGNMNIVAGKLGIGTATPTEDLVINSAALSNPQITLQKGDVNKGFINVTGNDIKIGTTQGNTTGRFIIRTDGVDRMFVTDDGKIYTGTSPSFMAHFGVYPPASITYGMEIGNANCIYSLRVIGDPIRDNNSSTWHVTSDRRLKKDIHSYDDGLQQLLQINPVKYHYNTDLIKADTAEVVGTIAQDLQKIAPYMVKTNKEGYLGIDYHALFFMMINAFKEVNSNLEASKERISVLEAALKNREPQTISVQDKKLEEMQKQIDELKKLLETRK